MNVWYHLPTIFNWRLALRIAGLITLCVALITTLFFSSTVHAAPGINQALSFQGRLLNSSGGAVPDGYYNMQFKIYQNGAGTTAGNPGGTLEWTESYINDNGTDGVQVKNGYFSVNLGTNNPFGTSVDWNQDTLWLSMNVAGSASDCTTFNSGTCVADGEMLPMKRLTAVPQALNSQMLGGKTADGFIQNGTSAQTADFNISGTGQANIIQGNTSVIAPLFDRYDAGTLNIGTSNATTINLGTANSAQTISIGTGTGNKTVTLGSTHGTSYTLIQGGSTGVRVIAGGGFAVQTPATGLDNFLVTNTGGIMVRLGNSEGFTIRNDADNGIFYVSSSLNRVGVNYSSNFLVQGSANFEQGITVTGGSALTYTTPGGYNMSTAINIPNYTVSAYSSVLALGLPSTSAATARGILVSDGRTVAHQATIGILSHDESSVFGLSYNGTNTGTLSNMGNSVALQGNGLNLLTATNNGGVANVGIGNDASAGYALDVTGAIRATTALYTPAVDTASAGTLTIGGTNATSISLAQNVTVAAGKSLTIAGGATNTRPASPSEGMVYFDTTTKKLLTYSNGKWQADRTDAVIVAANNSSQSDKDAADYVADGTGDQSEINSALTAASGKKVILLAGTYSANATITIPNNTTLAGVGAGSLIQLADIDTTDNLIENSDTSTGTGATLQDLKIDGQDTLNTAGTQSGIYFNNMGDYAAGRSGSTIRNVKVSNFRSQGIFYNSSDNNTLTGSTISGMDAGGATLGIYYESSSRNNMATNNTFMSNSYAVRADGSGTSNNSLTDNTFRSNSYGIMLYGATNTTVSGNNFDATTNLAVQSFNDTAASTYNNIVGNNFRGDGSAVVIDNTWSNTVSGNKIHDAGGATANNAIVVNNNSDRNSITNNGITDSSCTTNCYAISITSANADANYLSDNTIGASGTLNDLGTGTIYANQLDGNNKLINKATAGMSVQSLSPAASAFTVQNASNVAALTVDTTTNSVLVAGALDTTTAAAMTIGSSSATSITIGKTSSNTTTTLLGNVVVKPTTGNNSTTAFQLQRADGTAMLIADSTNQTITIGGASDKTVISTSTGQITKYGNARNTKKIALTAEYTGSVLDAGTGSNNAGTMTSSVDLTNRMNYYKWTTSQATNQSYDVVVQVPIPTDFDGWASSNPLSINAYTSNTTNGTITLEARDSSNAVQCNFVSVTPGSTSTWTANNSACTLSSGTYTAGDYMTLRIRMQSPTSGDVRVGNINLSYLSKY